MNRNAHIQRGAGIAETAIIVSFVLLLIFGALQIVLVGYLQTAADGAVFMSAHQYAIGNTNPATVASPFPGINVANITFSPAPPDTITVPVNYGLQNTTQRFGGMQTIRPQHLQASVQMTFKGLLGVANLSNLPINGGAVEGREWLADRGFSVDGFDPNSSQTFNAMIDPIHQDDQNVPPYFIGFHDMFFCSSLQKSACVANNSILALGVAEYLDADNYSTANDNDGVLKGGTFYAMACHQRVFASIIPLLPATINTSKKASSAYENDSGASGPIGQVYSWDLNITGVGSGSTTPGQNPLHPLNGCP